MAFTSRVRRDALMIGAASFVSPLWRSKDIAESMTREKGFVLTIEYYWEGNAQCKKMAPLLYC